MTDMAKIEAPTGLALLRQPFPPHQISKLPKETKAQIDARKADRNLMVFNCPVCGGHHHKNAVHLDYVGHAALTDRLLDCDPNWSWEPVAFGQDGLPAFDQGRGLWVKLTVCGVTRLGYGSADGKQGGDAIKEIIGDALRNAAMRFGAALDLWHKGDLHLDDELPVNAPEPEAATGPKKRAPNWDAPIKNKSNLHKALIAVDRNIRGCGDHDELDAYLSTDEYQAFQTTAEEYSPHYLYGGPPSPEEFVGIVDLITQMRAEFDAPVSTINAG